MKRRFTKVFASTIIFTLIAGVMGCTEEKSKISFTFDDGSTRDYPNYPLKDWNRMIIDKLQKHDVKAVFFATGSILSGEKGKDMLESWDSAGHKIANHSYSHLNFNSEDITAQMMERDILKNDSVIVAYKNYFPWFRFPYLKEGNTVEKRDSLRKYLAEAGYKHGYVTIDASDWYINNRLSAKLKEDPSLNTEPYRDFYIQHLFERACFYDSLAYQLTNRRVNHTLLLHHNLTSALFLDELIQFFRDNGWEILDAEEAYTDKVYSRMPDNIPAGESLIWAMAKESGRFASVLRYPAEDSRYEEDKMDNLGL